MCGSGVWTEGPDVPFTWTAAGFGFSYTKPDIEPYGISIAILQIRLLYFGTYFSLINIKAYYLGIFSEECVSKYCSSHFYILKVEVLRWLAAFIPYQIKSVVQRRHWVLLCDVAKQVLMCVRNSLCEGLKYHHLQHLEEWTVSHSQKSAREGLNYSPCSKITTFSIVNIVNI